MPDDQRAARKALAEDRTDLGEDRTLLANERTFSGWARTSMASIGIGVGFSALFRPIEPTGVAKAASTLFFALAIFLIIAAERRAHALQSRLNAHSIHRLSTTSFRIMAVAISVGAISLTIAVWWLT